MLTEDQAAELLKQCEALVGKRLKQPRNLLRLAKHRASVVWELIVIDSAGHLGKVNYEPQTGGSRPDVKLQLPAGRAVWLEATFLQPRFWKEEQKCEAVRQLIGQELTRRSIARGKIHYRFETAVQGDAGPELQLPESRECDLFLREAGLSSFLDAIQQQPDEDRSYTTPHYSISLDYVAKADGRYVFSTAPHLEAPGTLIEHALYRLLMHEADQHAVRDLPLILCVGSDLSPLLKFSPGHNQLENQRVVNEFFGDKRSVSAVIVVAIDSREGARGEIFRNSNAHFPLTDDEIGILCKLNFNRWTYTFPLKPWDVSFAPAWMRRVWGNPVLRPSRGPAMEVVIPTSMLVEILAGRTIAQEELGILAKPMLDRWSIVDCQFQPGDLQAGKPATVILKLVPVPPVYGLREPTGKDKGQ